MFIFPVFAFFCEGRPFWSKWHISQFLTRVTGGYVMLAEVVFRNVVTQRSTQVSTQLCLSSWKASGDSGLEFPVLRIFFSYSTRPKASNETLKSKIEGHLKILANLYHFTKNQIHSEY